MYRVVLCLLLVTHVVLGAEEEDLALDEQCTITDENLEKTVNEVPNFIVFVCKYNFYRSYLTDT